MANVNKTLSDSRLIKSFEHDCHIRGLSPYTIDGYVSSLNLFSSFLRQVNGGLLTVTREILRDYLSQLRRTGMNPKTIKNRFSAISSFCEYGVYERFIEKNVVLEIRKRYLREYKMNRSTGSPRKLISIAEMARFVHSILDTRDKAMVTLLAKTGIRRRELVGIDVDDINWNDRSITLKPTRKRSNRVVFFDHECAVILQRWLNKRETIVAPGCRALFVSYDTHKRLDRNGVYNAFIKWATKAGFHKPYTKKIEEHFTPHCCRHWFTTFLRRAGMQREFIQELRGDTRNEAIDIYYHIEPEELRKAYLAFIPQLGLE
jgi:integrase/recombinase XerD